MNTAVDMSRGWVCTDIKSSLTAWRPEGSDLNSTAPSSGTAFGQFNPHVQSEPVRHTISVGALPGDCVSAQHQLWSVIACVVPGGCQWERIPYFLVELDQKERGDGGRLVLTTGLDIGSARL